MQSFVDKGGAVSPAIAGGRPLFDILLPFVQPVLPAEARLGGAAARVQAILDSGILTNY